MWVAGQFEPSGIITPHAKKVWIAGAVGFLVGVFWLGFLLLVPVRDVQFVPILAFVTCPPFPLQFTFLAPFLNAVLYAFVALLWVGLRKRRA